MYLKTIKISQFRNYTSQVLEFSPHINVFLGDNAQGKTNLMEAIHVLALTKSHRTTVDKDLITWQEQFSKIEGTIVKQNTKLPLKMILHPKGKKVAIGKIEQKKLSEYVGNLLVVIFAPEDLTIIKGAPSYRRRFLDMQIGQVNRLYLTHLSLYQKILKQRNNYLKNTMLDTIYLDVLTEQLAKQAAIILSYRLQYLDGLQHYAKQINLNISQQFDHLKMHYISQIKYQKSDDVGTLYDKFMQYVKSTLDREIDQKMTLFGIHRDDIVFYVNGKNVQDFGSQGQQRTVALSLKLAEIDVIHEKSGEYPILLLDDVLSELDDSRQTYLLKTVENKVQTFMTTTSLDGIQKNLIKQPKIFHIKEGSVTLDGEK